MATLVNYDCKGFIKLTQVSESITNLTINDFIVVFRYEVIRDCTECYFLVAVVLKELYHS